MSPSARSTVAIIGGGITGLTAAHTLAKEAPDLDVVLLEAEQQLGGKLRSVDVEGVRLEAGADSFLVREPFALDLCREVGLEAQLIEPAVFGGLVWDLNGLHPLPTDAVMGVPTSAKGLVGNKGLTLRGRFRGLADLIVPGPLVEDDVAAGPFLRRRFGREIVDTMVDPILAGTRAGDPDQLSLRYAMPQVYAAARNSRSVMKGLSGSVPASRWRPRFNAPRGGMRQLVSALEQHIGDTTIKTGTAVTSIEEAENGYRLYGNAGSLEVDAVLVAVPASAATKLLANLAPQAAAELSSFRYASAASIALIYNPGTLDFPSGSSGFLVPSASDRLLSAGTWWSKKWPHAANNHDVVRCFAGRAGRDPALDLDDDELARRAAEEVGELLHTGARPTRTRVDRWEDGLPQYLVGHGAKMEKIDRALGARPGIRLAGADYQGTGIPDCVRQAIEAARRIIEHLSDGRPALESEKADPERKEK